MPPQAEYPQTVKSLVMKHWREIVVGLSNGILLSVAGVPFYDQPVKFYCLLLAMTILEKIGIEPH